MSGGVAHYSRRFKSWRVRSEQELDTLHFAVLRRCVSSLYLSRGRCNLVLQHRRWNIPSQVPLEKGWIMRSVVFKAVTLHFVLCSLSLPLKPEPALSLHSASKSSLFTTWPTDTADVTAACASLATGRPPLNKESPGSCLDSTASAEFSFLLPQPLPAQTSRRC